jgi:hypothetical protein
MGLEWVSKENGMSNGNSTWGDLKVTRIAAGQCMGETGEQGGLWRVLSGVVRLDRAGKEGPVLVMLAQPSDLLGVESLCGQTAPFSANALTDVVLAPVFPSSEQERQQLLIEAVLQHPQRSHDMARLRTGPVLTRVGELLRVLGHTPVPGFARTEALDADAVRDSLPALRALAEVVDAKPETVCRALAQLLPPRTRKGGPPRGWRQVAAAAMQAIQPTDGSMGGVLA